MREIGKPNLSPPPSPVLNSLSHSMESLHIQRHISIPSLTLLQRHMEANDSLPNSPAHKSLRNTVSSSPASLSHQNILQIYDVMEVDDALCIVSELAKGGNLLWKQSIICILRRVIVHRDLKLENIMVLGGLEKGCRRRSDSWRTTNFIPTLKICDFGLSDFIHGDLHEVDEKKKERKMHSNASFGVGSLHYCSPEDLRGTVTPQNGAPSDIWALACILYAIVTGGLPFNDCWTEYSRADSKDKNPLYILLKGMFDVNVTKRLTLSQILESEWLET
ncbi:kinase-like domain-containing protein, partial [Obelidium mucronatum]